MFKLCRPAVSRAPFLALLAIWALSSVPTSAAEDRIRLLTNVAPPYQEMVDGRIDGTSLRALNCIMDRLGKPYEVALAPWSRARELTRQGTIDGLFSVAPAADLPRDQRLSLPLALERWVWVSASGHPPVRLPASKSQRLAAVLGSNQLKWLETQGVAADGAARSASQLLRMVLAGRIDAALMDEAELQAARQDDGIDVRHFQTTFQRYMPLGVYFSDPFLSANPGFMDRFNGEVAGCATGNMTLSNHERHIVMELAGNVLRQVKALPGLMAALRQSGADNAGRDQGDLLADDRAFTNALGDVKVPAVRRVANHPLTQALGTIRAASGGQLSELLIFDTRGVMLAADPLSGDLWQGDEAKFTKTVGKSGTVPFVDQISFDESTAQFLVQVSFTLTGDQPGEVLGGLTVGLNVEKVLNPH